MLRQQVPLTELARLVQRFAEATALQWELALQRQESPHDDGRRAARWGLREWYLTLIAQRIWEDIDEFAHFIFDADCRIGIDLFERSDHRSFANLYNSGVLALKQRRFSDQALLQSAPCPLLHYWNPYIQRLIDKLLLAVADVQYLRHNDQVPELIPILLAARLSASDPPMYDVLLGPESPLTAVKFGDLPWMTRDQGAAQRGVAPTPPWTRPLPRGVLQ